MVDAHYSHGDPTLPFLPRHPMWDSSHVYRRQDRLAHGSGVQQTFQPSDRLVVAHVLIHRKSDPGLFAQANNL